MKGVFLALLVAGLAANASCTTLQPTQATPDEIQRLILADGILEPGQRVRLVTADEAVHEFRITAIDAANGIVYGRNHSVAIEAIVAVETRKISAGRTALLTGGLAYGLGVLIAIALAPAAILGGL